MVKIEGRILVQIVDTQATKTEELTQAEYAKIMELEQKLNGEIATDLHKQFGFGVRFHL